MRTYSEKEVFNAQDVEFFHEATRIVGLLPDVDKRGELLRCHEVARVVGQLLALEVQDGKYELGAEHSWCVLRRRHILDVYAVGRLPPVQLVAVVSTMPQRYKVKDIGLVVRKDVVRQLLNHIRDRNN